MRTILDYNVALGGYCYRVTADKYNANLQEKTPTSSRFVTRKTIARSTFEVLAEKLDLYNVYDQNPRKIASLIATL